MCTTDCVGHANVITLKLGGTISLDCSAALCSAFSRLVFKKVAAVSPYSRRSDRSDRVEDALTWTSEKQSKTYTRVM